MAIDLMSSRRLAKELIGSIDVLSDPLAAGRNPLGYSEAYRDLYILVGNEERWASIFEVQPGNKSNRVLHEVGAARMEWLKKWRDDELRKVLAE